MIRAAVLLLTVLAGASGQPICAVITADQAGPDGKHTAAIQQQIDSCNTRFPNQTAVELSSAKGANFTSGPLYLQSNVVLRLDGDVVLHASTDPADFQRTSTVRTQACDSTGAIPVCGTLDAANSGCQALVNGCKIANAGVAGMGTIEGHGWSPLTGGANQGTTWWGLATAAKSGGYAQSLNAPKIVNFQQSTSITVQDITIHNAPLVHMLFGKDNGVSVFMVTIVTPTPDHTISSYPYNSDGMDISGSTNVQVNRVDFTTGDDNVALEGGGNGPVQNVSVTNSTFRAGHGLSIGSPTYNGVTNVTAANIAFLGTDNGLRIKSDMSSGGVVDQVRYSTVCMKGVKNPIVIDPYYSTASGNRLPQFKAVEIDGFYADAGSLVLRALAGQAPLQLTLNNTRIDKLGSVAASSANILEISDPKFPFPVAIPAGAGVSVTQSQAAAAPPEDIKSYCQSALGLAQAAAPVNIVSAASYAQNTPVAADSIVSLFAKGLANGTFLPSGASLPLALGGASVSILDANAAQHAAELFAVTPAQINTHVPADVALGPAALSVTTASGRSFWTPITVASAAPALFSASASGTGAAAAQLVTNHADGTQSTQFVFQCAAECAPVPLDLGAAGDTVALVLYATGVRNVAAANVTVTVGNTTLQPFYVGPAPTWVGLDQVNVILPHSLAGTGMADVAVTANGTTSNAVTASFR